MALSDKDILITTNKNQTADPKIEFKGADASTGAQTITLNVYPTNNGTITFDGSAGQLFSISNSLSGTIYSVNDISGIPSIEVLDTGLIKLGQYSGNIVLGSATDDGVNKLQVNGTISHKGVNLSAGTSVDQVYSTTKSLTLTTAWIDTGISSTDLASGTYIIQISDVSDYTVGGGQYNETYSGIMTWYASATNSTEFDEIILHKAGHAPNGRHIFLRTLRNSSGILKLQISSNGTNSGAYSYVFKFRRML